MLCFGDKNVLNSRGGLQESDAGEFIVIWGINPSKTEFTLCLATTRCQQLIWFQFPSKGKDNPRGREWQPLADFSFFSSFWWDFRKLSTVRNSADGSSRIRVWGRESHLHTPMWWTPWTNTLIFLCQNHLQVAKKYARKLGKTHWKDF